MTSERLRQIGIGCLLAGLLLEATGIVAAAVSGAQGALFYIVATLAVVVTLLALRAALRPVQPPQRAEDMP